MLIFDETGIVVNMPAETAVLSTTTSTTTTSTTTSATSSPVAPAWNGVSWVVSSAALALLPIMVLHVTGSAFVHPLLDPISYYALMPGGYALVFLGCALLGASGVCLAIWLARSGMPGARLPAGLLMSFAVAFLLVGIFPTDPIDAQFASLSATIHRFGAGWGVVVVPIAGILVARGAAATARSPYPARLVRLAKWVAALMAIFFAIHLPLAVLGSRIPAFGLLERVGFALVIGYLVLIAVTVRREGYRGADPGGRESLTERGADVGAEAGPLLADGYGRGVGPGAEGGPGRVGLHPGAAAARASISGADQQFDLHPA